MSNYDPTKPCYDAWGNKFSPNLHAMRKDPKTGFHAPAQDKNGRFKFKPSVKKMFAKALQQQELQINDKGTVYE